MDLEHLGKDLEDVGNEFCATVLLGGHEGYEIRLTIDVLLDDNSKRSKQRLLKLRNGLRIARADEPTPT